MKKPRADSELKTLPPAAQEELHTLLLRTSYKKAVPLVREKFGVRKVSVGSLQSFFAWYPLSRRIEQARDFADQLARKLKAENVDLADDRLARAAQVAFELRAVEEQDPGLYLKLRRLRIQDDRTAIQERKVALLEEKAAQAKAQIEAAVSTARARGGLSPETIAAIEQAAAIL